MEHEKDQTFTQIFVARSQRICDYVKEVVGPSTRVGGLDDETPATTYLTFSRFFENCESVAYDNKHPFPSRNRIDFSRFKEEYGSIMVNNFDIDPLTVWTQVRSFIKGSIEALIENEGEPLSKEQYLDTKMMGSKRCRLNMEERENAYAAFQKYEEVRCFRMYFM